MVWPDKARAPERTWIRGDNFPSRIRLVARRGACTAETGVRFTDTAPNLKFPAPLCRGMGDRQNEDKKIVCGLKTPQFRTLWS